MAKQMSYVSEAGVTFEASYWRPVQILLDIGTKTARVVFHGFASVETRQAGKSPVGSKVYAVASAIYDTYFSATALGSRDPLAASYQLADDVLDTNSASFFATAENV